MRPPFPFSLLQQAAAARVVGATIVIAGLWLAIAWAVSLP
jgi:hypothetical protein